MLAPYLIIVLIVIIAVVIVSYINYKNINSWYFTNAVIRPLQAPPPIVFGIVWFILYAIYAYTWCIAYKETSIKPLVNAFFMISLILNVLWVVVFFGFHQINHAKIIIVMLLILVLFQAWLMWSLESGLGTFLMLVYAAWLIVATGLNFNTYLST
jgi:translocator protein